jgi:hypothetical protein
LTGRDIRSSPRFGGDARASLAGPSTAIWRPSSKLRIGMFGRLLHYSVFRVVTNVLAGRFPEGLQRLAARRHASLATRLGQRKRLWMTGKPGRGAETDQRTEARRPHHLWEPTPPPQQGAQRSPPSHRLAAACDAASAPSWRQVINQGDNRTAVSQVTADRLESHKCRSAGAFRSRRSSLGTSVAEVPDWGGSRAAPFLRSVTRFAGAIEYERPR